MGEESSLVLKLLVIIIICCIVFVGKVMYKHSHTQVKPVEPSNVVTELTNEVQ